MALDINGALDANVALETRDVLDGKVVLDTNVVLDLWHFSDPKVRALRAALDRGTLQPLVSDATLAELGDVLTRAPFAAHADSVLNDYAACWTHVAATAPAPWRCRDPDDQPFLDLACHAGAGSLLTRDRALLRLARRARCCGLTIVAPGSGGVY